MSDFKTPASVLSDLGQRWVERMTDEDKASVEDVLDAALECDEGRMPLYAFAQLGTVQPVWRVTPSASYTRMLAMMTSRHDDPRRRALRRCLDRLLIEQGNILTTHGLFVPGDLPPDVPVIGSYQRAPF